MSDVENAVLNTRGINALRVFPNGIVNWGALTMDGDRDFGSEYKYISIRRMALYMEESLYRCLKWVAFEPNDEPLWSQIRLNVGAFMHNLYRQGALQGQTPNNAYFVKCDIETMSKNNRDLGRVRTSSQKCDPSGGSTDTNPAVASRLEGDHQRIPGTQEQRDASPRPIHQPAKDPERHQ